MKAWSILPRYAPIPWKLWLFFRLRLALTPYLDMVRDVPAHGRVLDLGCGHGFLSLLLATDPARPGLRILGLDHDSERVALAQRAAQGLPALEFRVGDERSLASTEQFDAILAIDFLHYFSREQQVLLLRSAVNRLAPGGQLIFREIDPEGGWASKLNRLYEWAATTFGFTRSERKSTITLRAPDDWEALASDLGLKVRQRPCTHFLFADVLFTGIKEARA